MQSSQKPTKMTTKNPTPLEAPDQNFRMTPLKGEIRDLLAFKSPNPKPQSFSYRTMKTSMGLRVKGFGFRDHLGPIKPSLLGLPLWCPYVSPKKVGYLGFRDGFPYYNYSIIYHKTLILMFKAPIFGMSIEGSPGPEAHLRLTLSDWTDESVFRALAASDLARSVLFKRRRVPVRVALQG